ncbi:mitochondrial pyruvate carrier 1 isoform X1 [Sminthopsis crassicaudata]|uniref:mitochondrial pyruvate carrier 1 isoform X1 n=1 Tax=Sminthopsis crassicaudata TaxID=9301 RepID=UPI003D682E98
MRGERLIQPTPGKPRRLSPRPLFLLSSGRGNWLSSTTFKVGSAALYGPLPSSTYGGEGKGCAAYVEPISGPLPPLGPITRETWEGKEEGGCRKVKVVLRRERYGGEEESQLPVRGGSVVIEEAAAAEERQHLQQLQQQPWRGHWPGKLPTTSGARISGTT